MTWADMQIKYPEGRENMAVGREQEFINDCFSCYEAEGFAKKFWSPFEKYKDRVGHDFVVLKRCSAEDQDLCTLPMWKIQFGDGTVIGAYPEEIIPSERVYNGCPS